MLSFDLSSTVRQLQRSSFHLRAAHRPFQYMRLSQASVCGYCGFSSRQARAMLSANHFQHGFNSASQGRGPVAATFLSLAAEMQRKISFLDLRGQTKKKMLPSLPTTCLLLAVTGDASNHGKRPRRHNLRAWGTYMTTCYQSNSTCKVIFEISCL